MGPLSISVASSVFVTVVRHHHLGTWLSVYLSLFLSPIALPLSVLSVIIVFVCHVGYAFVVIRRCPLWPLSQPLLRLSPFVILTASDAVVPLLAAGVAAAALMPCLPVRLRPFSGLLSDCCFPSSSSFRSPSFVWPLPLHPALVSAVAPSDRSSAISVAIHSSCCPASLAASTTVRSLRTLWLLSGHSGYSPAYPTAPRRRQVWPP